MARSCEKWWQSSYLYYFFKPATFLSASGQARRVYMLHTAYHSCSLKLAPLCWGFVTIKASHHPIPLRPASHNSLWCVCASVCLCECICVCKAWKSPWFLLSTPPLHWSLCLPPFSLCLLFSLSISGLINNSLHSPWCLVTFPSHSPPWLPPLTSRVLSSV